MNLFWILLIALAIVLFFYILISGVEYSFLVSNPLTLEIKRDQKKRSNTSLGKLLDQPDIFWRTTTAVKFLLVILLTILFYNLCYYGLKFNGVPSSFKLYFESYPYMLWLASGFITLICIYLFKRLITKPIYERKPENKVNGLSSFIVFLSHFFNPIMKLMKSSAQTILVLLFNARINKDAPIFLGINPYNFFRQSVQGHNVLEKLNKKFFRGALDLTQISVRNCITPRTELVAIDNRESMEALNKKFVETKVSKILIYEKHLDNIIGYVHHLDMNTNPPKIEDILLPLPVVPSTMSALELIRSFTKDRKSIAQVVDEFGGTLGIVTMEDILEEIFGNIKDEYDYDELVEKKLTENEYVFSGRLKIDYLNTKYNLNLSKTGYETLSGYIIGMHESIPIQKQKIIIGKYEFEILLVTSTKIESVRMRILNH